MSRKDAAQWRKAMEEEIKSIIDNQTWDLSDLPANRQVIGTKWVLKKKRDGNNNVIRYKARVVAKGYSQIAGFLDRSYPNKVLRLQKSLYGLKQAPRIWYLLLCQHILNLGFKSCESDPSIYINIEKSIILSVYVDDILIFGLNQRSCETIFQQLSSQFKMQNLGPPKTFLGLNITRNASANTISINQTGYIHRMLKRFNMQNAVPAKTPLPHSLPLLKATKLDRRCNQLEYMEITGSLNHLAVYSRPDIAFAVSTLSQFNSDPTTTHLQAARHVLRYLINTANYSITYGDSDLTIHGYADANWGGDRNDRKSTTGYIFFANNGAISWTSHKQTTVALSTMEAEYMLLSDSSREAIARLQLFKDIHTYTDIPTIFSDNQGALTIATNPTDHQRAKHIDIRYHFIRNCIQNNSILIDYIPTASQTADILTKALPPILHERNIALIKFTNTTSSQSQFLV